MAHGHIQALIDAQVPIIFYPGVVLNSKKQWKQIIILIVQLCKATQMLFRNNVDAIREGPSGLSKSYLNLANETAVAKVLAENFADLGISLEEIQTAASWLSELAAFKRNSRKGEETLAMLTEKAREGLSYRGDRITWIQRLITALPKSLHRKDSMS